VCYHAEKEPDGEEKNLERRLQLISSTATEKEQSGGLCRPIPPVQKKFILEGLAKRRST